MTKPATHDRKRAKIDTDMRRIVQDIDNLASEIEEAGGMVPGRLGQVSHLIMAAGYVTSARAEIALSAREANR